MKELYLKLKTKYFDPFIEKAKVFYSKHEYFRVFSMIFGACFFVFLPFSIFNGFTLPMNGDYCLQQLHFYCEAHDAIWHFIKTGEIVMWSSSGFLGVNYFAANTFYYLSSPFLIPFIFTPKILIPQMIFFMMVVKMAVGGLLFYILLKHYFNTSNKTSLIGGFVYALSGWGMYYLWFNHFHDVLALFPLLLIGIEHVLKNNKGWILSLSLMLIGMANYFFLFGFAILGVFYALFRYFQCFKANKGRNLKVIGNGILYYLLGILMVAYVLLPALGIVGDMSRVEDSSLLLNLFELFFENPTKTDSGYQLGTLKSFAELTTKENLEAMKKYFFEFSSDENMNLQYLFTPLAQTLFPPVNNWDPLLFKTSWFDNATSSMWISFPILLLLGVKIIRTIKTHNPWSIIWMIIAISLPFIPFVYYVLNAFSLVYGRWELFLVAIMLVNVIPLLDKEESIKKWEFDVSFIGILILIAISITISVKTNKLDMSQYRPLIAGAMVIYYFIMYYYLRKKAIGNDLSKKYLNIVLCELIVCGFIVQVGQGTQNYWNLYGSQDKLNDQRRLVNEINKEDDTYFRIENTLADRNANNLAMTLGYNGISTFHSVYNKELFTFINDYTKTSYSYSNWSMGIDEKRAYLNEFLGIKYLIAENDDINIPHDYDLYKVGKYYSVYKNRNFVELGYSVDNIIASKDFTSFSSTHFNYEAAFMHTAVVENEQFESLTQLLPNKNYIQSLGTTFTRVTNLRYNYISRELEDEDSGLFTSIYSLSSKVAKEREGMLYGPWVDANLKGDIITIQKPNDGLLIPNGNSHVILKLRYGPNVEIRMYNQFGKLVTKDTHGINYYDHSGDHKYARGFYTDDAVYKIEIELLNDCRVSEFTSYDLQVYYVDYDQYEEKISQLQSKKVLNVKHTKNTFSFDTNYENDEFVVLNIPIDKGWTLTCDNEEIDMYKSNGGFIGFIARSGLHHYKLNYVTPSLMLGVGVSIGSSFIFFILTFSSFYVVEIKEKKLKIRKRESK